ncbi:trigger factor [Chlorobium ferrooxidans]|uniref:Trigger factor n=1 Tax=Chlorobium ferrooxidans DSM 13031 TaxID=377431 RepID=Q0YRT9_9CHLB|nr:trigger factor [Chlorobium ferrooxidans]EAT59048.1 trigger factor [Chlorobium ferrooxidans DSM 13031]
MQKNIKNVSETEQEVEIILSAEEFGADYNQELEEAKRTIQIKGFRKGHAPASLIKKLAGPSIEANIAEKLASKHFGEIVEAENIKPASRAQLIDFTFTPDLLTIRLSYDIHPEFELKDYSAYPFTRKSYSITDEDVQREINLILKGHGTMITVDEPAAATDTVIGDVIHINAAGEPDEEQKTDNHHFNLEYLPEDNPFRKELTGKKAGDVVEVTADQKDADIEPTRFRVTISEIKRLELPELTDELVKEITGGRFESVTDFTGDVRIQLTQHFEAKSEEELLESISAKLIEENPVPAPKSMVESFSNMLVENAKRQMGGNFPKSFDDAQFRLAMKPNAEKHAQWLLISQKIAELDKLTVTDDDIKAYAEKEAGKNASMNAEDLLGTYLSAEFRDYITDTILKEKIYEIIKSKITITEEVTPVPVHHA